MSLLQNEEAAVQNAGLLVDNRSNPTVDRNNAARAGVELLSEHHIVDETNPDKSVVAMTNDELTVALFQIPEGENIRDYPNLRAITGELAGPQGKIQYGLNGSGLHLCTTTVDRDYVTESGIHSRKPFVARYVSRMGDLIMDDFVERAAVSYEAIARSTARKVALAVQRHPELADRARNRLSLSNQRNQLALAMPEPADADDHDSSATAPWSAGDPPPNAATGGDGA